MMLEWKDIWFYSMLLITILIVLHIMSSTDYKNKIAPYYSPFIIPLFTLLIAFFFCNEEIIIYSDKFMYELDYIHAGQGYALPEKDIGFYIYTKIIASFTNSSVWFFFITAILYMMGYIIFITRKIIPAYQFILFVTILTSMGFYAYANNTLRAGLALSIFVTLLAQPYLLKPKTLVLLVIILLIHKSLLLPIVGLALTILYKRKDHYAALWMVCLLLSLGAGSTFVTLFGSYFSFADERVMQYAAEGSTHYKTGFRWDFVIFSVLPLALAWYYRKKGYNDPFYHQILSIYTICNAFWLLLIRMPFSDRLATLSWFLIPVIIMYPLLTKRIFEKQHFWIAGVLLANMLITITLNMKS